MHPKSRVTAMSYANLSASSDGIEGATRISPTSPLFLSLVVLALSWGFVFNALRVDWSTNPQYNYGWFVPLLALGLYVFRWKSRPEPAQLSSPDWQLVLTILGCALAALLPIRLIE